MNENVLPFFNERNLLDLEHNMITRGAFSEELSDLSNYIEILRKAKDFYSSVDMATKAYGDAESHRYCRGLRTQMNGMILVLQEDMHIKEINEKYGT